VILALLRGLSLHSFHSSADPARSVVLPGSAIHLLFWQAPERKRMQLISQLSFPSFLDPTPSPHPS